MVRPPTGAMVAGSCTVGEGEQGGGRGLFSVNTDLCREGRK